MSRRCLALGLLLTACQAPTQDFAFDPKPDDFRSDALLDLRYLNEKVAGENGFVKVDAQGDFTDGSGKPLRFWAVNTMVGREVPYTQRPLWPGGEPNLGRHARFLAKRGVNMVRLHAHVNPSPQQAIDDIDAKERDWIWRTVAAMKKEGIYTTVSPYWGVQAKIGPSWGIEGAADPNALALLFIDPKLKAAYKTWLRKLLAERNPHTGISLANDPALGIIQIQNEDSLLFWTVNSLKGQHRARLERMFGEFLKKKYPGLSGLPAPWQGSATPEDKLAEGRYGVQNIWELTQVRTGGTAARLDDQLEFLSRTMYDFNAEIGKFLRDDLKCKQVVNAGNWRTADTLRLNDAERWSYTANEVDAVNRYFGGVHKGPNEGWAIVNGDKFTSPSVVKSPMEFPLAVRQAVGRPMMVTESTWVFPNGRAAESPFLVAAYSALTGVDAYFWFATGDEGWSAPKSANGYMPSQMKWIFATPDMMGGFPAAALLYRTALVKRGAPVVIEERSNTDLWTRRLPLIAEESGFDPNRDAGDVAPRSPVKTAVDPLAFFIGPVQVKFGGDAANTKVAPMAGLINRDAGTVKSNTNELTLDYKQGFVRLDAPAAQGVSGFLGAVPGHKLSALTIMSKNEFGSFLAVSMDGKPLNQSSKVLLQYTGSARPTDWQEAPVQIALDGGRTQPGQEVKNYGKAPWRVKAAQIEVGLLNPNIKKAQALDANGNAISDLPLRNVSGEQRLTFPANALYVILS